MKLSKDIDQKERLIRYLFNKKNRVVTRDFLQKDKKDEIQKVSNISLTRIKGIYSDTKKLHKLAEIARGDRPDSLKGAALLTADIIRGVDNIDVESDTSGDNHETHAIIIIKDKEKIDGLVQDFHLDCAVELADKSKFIDKTLHISKEVYESVG